MKRDVVGRLLCASSIVGLFAALPIRNASAEQGRLKPGTILFRADGKHGWEGWKAEGWRVEKGTLIGDATRLLVGVREIRVPFSPAGQHLVRYDVRIHLRQTDTGPDDGFGIRVHRAGQEGDGFDICCGAGEFLYLRSLPSDRILASTDIDGLDPTQPRTYVLSVRGKHLVGAILPTEGDVNVVRGRDRHAPRGGYVSLYVGDGTRAEIDSIQIVSE